MRTFTEQEVLGLLLQERKRAVDIAYEFMKNNENAYESKLKAEKQVFGDGTDRFKRHSLAFIKKDIANECRLVGNAISGGNALSYALGETMEDRIKSEYSLNMD